MFEIKDAILCTQNIFYWNSRIGRSLRKILNSWLEIFAENNISRCVRAAKWDSIQSLTSRNVQIKNQYELVKVSSITKTMDSSSFFKQNNVLWFDNEEIFQKLKFPYLYITFSWRINRRINVKQYYANTWYNKCQNTILRKIFDKFVFYFGEITVTKI